MIGERIVTVKERIFRGTSMYMLMALLVGLTNYTVNKEVNLTRILLETTGFVGIAVIVALIGTGVVIYKKDRAIKGIGINSKK